jgi:ribosomal protein S18 acetylase RimI-like enzyme
MTVSFATMVDRQHAAQVLRMMRELYATDAPDLNVNPERFPATIDRLLAEPSRGRILLFMREAEVCGYALLIPYWSNEFGGMVLLIDELLVEKEFRGQGMARAFFDFIATDRPFDAVALALEVVPKNVRARALYESMGFRERHHRMLTRSLAP